MKRFITISAAVVLGTLAFNVTLAHASNGNKDNKNKHDSDSKHMKHDDCFKDFWKDLCYDFSHDGCHDHHGSGSSTVYHMGGSNYGPPGTPENPTPVKPSPVPLKYRGLQDTHLLGTLTPAKTFHPLPKTGALTLVQRGRPVAGNQQIPTLNGGFGSFSGAVGQGVTAGLNAAGSVVGGVAKGVESVGVGVASAVGDVASGIGGAISDIF